MKKLKISLYIAFFMIICVFTLPLSVKAEELFKKTEEDIPILKVAVSNEESITTERILNEALKRLGYQMNYVRSSAEIAITTTINQNAEILASYTKDLEEDYPDLMRVPFSHTTAKVIAYARDNFSGNLHSWEDLSDIRVGFILGNLCEEKIGSYSSFSVGVTSVEEAWEALSLNQVDVVLLYVPNENEQILPKGIIEVETIESIPLYSYVNKNYSDLVPLLLEVFKSMEKDGSLYKIRNNISLSNEKVILYISSYHSGMKWENELMEGIRKGLGSFDNSNILHFYLNTGRTKNREVQQFSLAHEIHGTLIEYIPDVIIVSDNEAFEFVIENYHHLFYKIPTVFCGINSYNSEQSQGISSYFTGCTESVSAITTIQRMLHIYPETNRIYIINDDSPTGRLLQNEIQTQLSKLKLEVEIEYNKNLTIEELMEEMEALDNKTLVLLGSYFVDKNNTFILENDLQKQLCSILKTPLFTLLSSYLGDGAVGGMLVNAINQGFTAGTMASQILSKASVSSIPIVYASESLNEWIFDQKVLRKFSIPERKLPDKYTLLHTNQPFYKTIIFYQILTFGFLFLLILCLLFIYHLRKQNKILKFNSENTPKEQKELIYDLTMKNMGILMEHLPFVYAIVSNGMILDTNEMGRTVIGMERNTAIVNYYKNKSVYEKVVKKLEHKKFVSGEYTQLIQSDGSVHRYAMNHLTMDFGNKMLYFMVAFDMEELEYQKDSVRRAGEDMQKILNALPTAMAIIDIETNKIEYGNREYLTLYGFKNMADTEVIDYELIVEQVIAMWQGYTVVFDYTDKILEERDINLKLYVDQIVFNRKNCIVLIGQDITTETKKAKMLMNAAAKEREANQLKGIFLANMSHEIRTPMNAIIGLSGLALMKDQTSENSDFFYKINSSAKNLLSIINDILDFSKIEAEKLSFIEDEFCLEETIINVFLVTTERIDDKKIEILLDMSPDVPYYLIGDKTRLWQVLKNLTDNCVKYTKEGRVIVSIEISNDFGASQLISNDTTVSQPIILTFHIKDTGIGMTRDQLDRLFSPFERFNQNDQNKPGTGLGMSITKKLIDMMHGSIRVESIENVGTDFYVTIPFKRAKNQKTMKDSMIETIGNRTANIGAILLVDDDETSLAFMSAILKNVGISSICATNGEQALALVREQVAKDAPFGIIILDYLLSGDENGIDLARKINAISENTKLLLVTAYLRRIISEQVLKEIGFKDVIEKPYVVSTFLQKVCSVIPEIVSTPKIKRNKYPNARILLCEDNEINQMLVVGILETYDIIPAIANDGAEALTLLEDHVFDLILMDIMMPVMDGHETTKAIRQSNKPYQNVPIVAMTANVMQDEVERCLNEGMNGHLEKPIDMDKFQEILEIYVSDR